MKRLVPQDTLLLVIDVQERLAPAMHPEFMGRMLRSLRQLGAAQADLPFKTLITEQYPKGLGSTMPAVKEAFGDVPTHAKMSFSAWDDEAIRAAIEAAGCSNIVLAGMETHICVWQTARDLRAANKAVWLLSDGVASRQAAHVETGLALATAAGAWAAPTETILFDWLQVAGTDAFKRVSKLVR